MTVALTFLDAVTGLLVSALGDRLAPGVRGYMDLFHETGVLETPYAGAGGPNRWEGKSEIAAFLGHLQGVIRLADFNLVDIYPVQDGVTVVLEYEGMVLLERDGTRFQQRYISVLRVERGRISLWREYTNPSASKVAAAAA